MEMLEFINKPQFPFLLRHFLRHSFTFTMNKMVIKIVTMFYQFTTSERFQPKFGHTHEKVSHLGHCSSYVQLQEKTLYVHHDFQKLDDFLHYKESYIQKRKLTANQWAKKLYSRRAERKEMLYQFTSLLSLHLSFPCASSTTHKHRLIVLKILLPLLCADTTEVLPLSTKPLVLKILFLDQEHQHHLGTCQEGKLLAPPQTCLIRPSDREILQSMS